MADEFNPDITTLGRGPIQYVTIFEKPELLGRLNHIEQQVEAIREYEVEPSLGDSEASTLEDEYERIYQEMDDSKREYQVRGMTPDQVEKVAQKAREACKKKADEEAAIARKWGKEQAEREGVTDPSEVSDIVRRHGREAAAAVIQQEIGFYTLQAALVEPRLDLDEVRELADKIGQVQVQKLLEAFYTAASRDPATVPKSLRRGKKDGDQSL